MKRLLQAFFGMLACMSLGAETALVLPKKVKLLTSDQAVFKYCQGAQKRQKSTRIAIIWPKALEDANYILGELSAVGTIRYVKELEFTGERLRSLYIDLHKNISVERARKYFKNYVPVIDGVTKYKIIVVVFTTDNSLVTIAAKKNSIRTKLGKGHAAIHINDTPSDTRRDSTYLF